MLYHLQLPSTSKTSYYLKDSKCFLWYKSIKCFLHQLTHLQYNNTHLLCVLIDQEMDSGWKLSVTRIYSVICSFLPRLRVPTLMGSCVIGKVWVFRWGDCFHEPSPNPFIKVPQNWTWHLFVSDQRELAIMGAAVCTVQRLKAVQFKETPK